MSESLQQFVDSLSDGLGKTKRRFMLDALTGILISRSLNLKHIAGTLNENIRLHGTEKRLSRNLGDTEFTDRVRERLLDQAARFVGPLTQVLIRKRPLTKKYATHMHLLGSDKILPVDDGYQVCDIIATDENMGRCVPIHTRLWSHQQQGFISDTDEMLAAVREVRNATSGRGMWHTDDEHLATTLVQQFDQGLLSNSSVADDLRLRYRNHEATVAELRDACKTPFGFMVYWLNEAGKEEQQFVHYGVLPVRMNGVSRRLSLLAVKSERAMLNCSHLIANGMRHRREEISNATYVMLEGIEAARAYRQYKAGFDLTSFRVLTYERLQCLMALLQAAIFYELAVRRDGLSFEPQLMFRPHGGDRPRDYLLPPERIPRSRFIRPTRWWR